MLVVGLALLAGALYVLYVAVRPNPPARKETS
jgi:hypothetical protein